MATSDNHATTRTKSIVRHLESRGNGMAMQTDRDDLLIGRLRCLGRGFGEFSSVAEGFDDEAGGDAPVYSMRFCPVEGHRQMLALANEDGQVAFQDTSEIGRMERLRKRRDHFVSATAAHKNAVFDLAWPADDATRMVTVSGDQTAKVWDVSAAGDCGMRCAGVFRGHSRSVKAVEFRTGSRDVFATASRDNSVRLWDIRSPHESGADNVIRNAHKVQHNQNPSSSSPSSSTSSPHRQRRAGSRQQQFSSPSPSSSSVTGIKFGDENTLYSCGDNDGVVKAWDVRRSYSAYRGDPVAKQQFLHPGDTTRRGFTSLVLDSDLRFLFASCMDNKVYRYNLVGGGSDKPTRAFVGCDNSSFFVRISLSPDGRYLASGSRDTRAYVWNASRSGSPIAALEGHGAEVTCVEWCSVGWRLATCADDMKHRLWEMSCREGVDPNEVCGEAAMTPMSYVETGKPYRRIGDVLVAPEVGRGHRELVLTGGGTPSKHGKGGGSAKLRSSKSATQDISSFLRKRLRVNNEEQDLPSAKKKKRMPLSAVACNNVPSSPPPQPGSNAMDNFPCSPNKMTVVVTPQKKQSTPRKLAFSPLKQFSLQSPTANMPNLVKDGRSPHTNKTPQRTVLRPTNWLTALSRQRKKKENACPAAAAAVDKKKKGSKSNDDTATAEATK